LDNYRWLRNKENSEVIQYLNLENDYSEAVMAPTKALQESLYQEMRSRIKETDLTVPEKLGSYLKAHPVINNLYKINNGYDFLAEGVFTNVKELEDFLEDLETKFLLEEKKTHYIIEDIKREEFMSGGSII
jgi:DNA-binding Lrp family transcriptional regulator